MVVASFAKHLLGISARRFAFETRFTDLSETSALICRKIRSHIGPIRIQKVAVITDGVPRRSGFMQILADFVGTFRKRYYGESCLYCCRRLLSFGRTIFCPPPLSFSD